MMIRLLSAWCVVAAMVFGANGVLAVEAGADQSARDRSLKEMQAGNHKDAYEGFRKLALDPNDEPLKVGDDLRMGLQCLQNLNRTKETDDLLEAVIKAHQKNWRLLASAAQDYLNLQHQGFMIAGKFERGYHRGGGRNVNSVQRDRVRALQLMVQAMPLARQDDNHTAVGEFFLSLSRMLLSQRGYSEAWRLQALTDLKTLPDYEEGWWGGRGETHGAPVDEQGKPVFYAVPKTWEEAKSDGERWRWCLVQAMEFDANRGNEIKLQFADFLRSQFGVQTMACYGWNFGRLESDDTRKDESGTYALDTLGENETIARLATGVKRFNLPDEFNFVKLYQEIAESAKDSLGASAITSLAQIFENRRQYPKAADYWRKAIERSSGRQQQNFKDRLQQIVGNWGHFEPVMTQPAGKGASVEFRFRNGRAVEFTAQEINIRKLLDDVKEHIKSRPRQLDWRKVNIGNIGYRILEEQQQKGDPQKYLGRQVAQWHLDLDPQAKHFDRRITVTTPLEKAGAYWVTAKMADGNTSHIVLWVADAAIAKKPLDGKTYYFVADAVTGKPIAHANLEFFGYWMQWRQNNRTEILIKQFAEFTDADGQVITTPERQEQNYQWIITATTPEGRLAYLGFTGVWYNRHHDAEYNETKVYTITDRPVYRPSQTVHYKFWIRHAKYDQEDTSDFAGQQFTVEIHNPKGERIVQTQVTTDAYAGIEGKLDLPADAGLGVYQLSIQNHGGGSFRVEEYKKPEFEVTLDAPKEPVMLGEKIQATIKAKYYFGSPVTKAKVKYKVTRTNYTERWYPPAPWDWFYGPGYWWFARDYAWYPGWHKWGCLAPVPFWWPQRSAPPEIVAEREVEIGEDGTVKVEIDTAVAKAIHPDQDHSYSISAEVVDQSRRTIVGTGSVLVARKPFSVNAWVDRGYYRVSDVITASFAARTLDGKPVQGKGELSILEIQYKDGKPVETPVRTWDLATNEEGQARHQMIASRAGQYRLSYKVTDSKGHVQEGGYLFTIIGAGFDSSQFRFNQLELIPDKREYQPGEKVKLQINTDRTGSTVLLFLRPANGVYRAPQVLRLEGKSTVAEIEVTKRDMPNFFVEAVTIADGKVYTDVREIVVPPEKRVLNVEVTPSSESYRPGQKAMVKIKLTDFSGEPFVGSTVVAIYDKSVEYISGGSNVPEIREFFWKWRRHHNPQTESSLSRGSGNLVPRGAKGMRNLGVFGGTVADEMQNAAGDRRRVNAAPEFKFTGRMETTKGMAFGGMGGMMADGAMPVPSAPAAAAPMMMEKAASGKDMLGAKADMGGGAPGAGAPALVQPTIRKEFADTALWVGSLTTQKDGTAEVSLKMPENLTTWRIKTWAMGHGTKVGEGQADVVTRKDLILRLQAPRFFVEKDEVVLSANVHNYLKKSKSVKVVLELEGKTLEPMGQLTQTVEIGAGKEARVDWRVKVVAEGQATVRMKALTDEESDAMEQEFPCFVHGMQKMDAWSGVIRPNQDSGKLTVKVPAERRPAETRLEVRFSPTLAGAMVDALPYMVDYPYGCTEQTLNRFLPTVITQKILIDMGIDLADVQKKRTNLNAQEIGDDAERAKQWKRYQRNPVFDQEEVRRMVRDGVQRLTEMQLTDGGWGWFSGWGEHSTPHTTAVVVHGLQIAQHNDVALVPNVLERGVQWLTNYQNEQVQLLKNAAKDPKPEHWKQSADNMDAFVYMVLVDAGVKNTDMHAFLYRDRTHLGVYALAMYGLAVEKLGDKEKLDMILRNIGQYLQQDDENQTAWLNLPGNVWWYWYGSEYEAMGYYLKLLAKTDPKGEVAPRLVKYLLNNRKHATYWNSTRDTAVVIEAMADYLKASGEQKPEMTVEVWYDGKLEKAVEITPAALFTFDNKFVLEGEAVATGQHQVELKRRGKGPLYYNAYLTMFSLEDPIPRAGLEVRVDRKYYKLKEVDKKVQAAGSRGQVVDQKVEKYERQPLENLAMLTSGDLVEIELVIDSKNDYEYLVFEDMKPAGFEPVELRSGYTGNEMGAFVEFRDNRVVFFVRVLARGKHSVSYRMRAEIPGKFSALPTKGWAMYAPELKANSDEIKLQVKD